MNNTLYKLKTHLIAAGDWDYLALIPDRFLTPLKLENFITSRKEEGRKAIILESMPYHLVIEPTNICNLKCPLCPTGSGATSRPIGNMPLADFKKLIDACEKYTIELYLQNWGEATLLPHLPEMIRYAAGKGIWTHLSTNFALDLKPDYLERLISSGLACLTVDVDGLSQAVYAQYRRGGRLEKVLENLKSAIRIKQELNRTDPQITATMIAMHHNEHQLGRFSDFCKQLPVDAHAISKLQINPNTTRDWLPADPGYVYKSYRQDAQNYPCHWPWSGLVINWDGGVSACCIVEDFRADFGNAFEEPVYQLWNNACFQSARAEFGNQEAISPKTICNVCRNDTHNRNLCRAGDSFAIRLER